MAGQSIERLIAPVAVQFDEALSLAVIGLVVNLACAWILRDRHVHGESHGTAAHHDHHHDHNLAAAYLHVVADALTSLLAIAALLGGKYLGWVALDALMGLVGAVVIAHWSVGLMRRSARVLLDAEDTASLANRVRRLIEDGTEERVVHLHVWRVGLTAYACIVTVVSPENISADMLKAKLAQVHEIKHLTVEVNRCE